MSKVPIFIIKDQEEEEEPEKKIEFSLSKGSSGEVNLIIKNNSRFPLENHLLKIVPQENGKSYIDLYPSVSKSFGFDLTEGGRIKVI